MSTSELTDYKIWLKDVDGGYYSHVIPKAVMIQSGGAVFFYSDPECASGQLVEAYAPHAWETLEVVR